MENKKETLSYIQDASMIVVGIFFLALPLVFASVTTDAFTLPKQILLTGFVFLGTILLCIRMFFEGKVRLQTTPFNLPLLILTIVMFVSAIVSLNRYDALIAFVPILFSILAFFIIINTIRSKQALFMAISGLVAGGVIVSIISVLAYFKIYIIPWADTHAQTFTPFGSMLDQAMYLALVLPLAGYIAYPLLSGRTTHSIAAEQAQDVLDAALTRRSAPTKAILFGVAFIAIAAGLLVTVFMLITIQKPLILPFETGFQTAFASISQDSGRVLWSFLFGSGVGTYLTDFTRFKSPAYNLDPNLWSFTFFRSSSFILELLATTGFLGVASFLFLVFRVLKEKAYFLPIVLAIIAAFLLPFSFTIILTFFILLAIFAIIRSHNDPNRYPHTEFYFVAFRQGLLAQHGHSTEVQSKYAAIVPLLFFGIFILFVGVLGFFTYQFVRSDIMFQQSLVAASQNDGRKTYDLQTQAINVFPYRDAYYRIFSQTNLALANSLAASQPQGSSPSAQVQQDILTLIQQSIASGRTAVNISPLSAMNWNNLSTIYRALIGFGENAEQFAVLTNQQAIALDPNNPQQYINFGGIYYQLGLWDDAARQFQIAINLKPDYANAYYNLGHTYENQNKLQEALQMYQTVQQLVANDPANLEQINKEIAALQTKIGQGTQQTNNNVQPSPNQEDLGVNTPDAQLPERDPREEIQGPPPVTPTPSRTTSPTPTPRN
jgi:hypothetical protein